MPLSWHNTLPIWAIVCFGFVFNTALAPQLPAIEVLFLVLHIVGWCGIFVILSVMCPSNHPRDTFTILIGGGGGNSNGLAAVIIMSNSTAMFVGYEAPVHMCKLPQGSRTLLPSKLQH